MADISTWIERSEYLVSEDELIGRIRVLVDVNSGSSNLPGIARVQDDLATMMVHLGGVEPLAAAEVTGIDPEGRPQPVPTGDGIVLTIRPDVTDRVLIMGHADTVFGEDHPFQESWLDGERLRGPGTADMKGGLVLAIHALTLLEASGAAGAVGIDLLISGDEETGSLGSAHHIERFASAARYGLALEPAMADGSMARARAGSANLTLVIRGRSAHAGRALADGRNAVLAAAEIGLIAADHGANVASIHGGNAYNSVPDTCVVRLNRRGPDAAEINGMIASLDQEIRRIEQDREVTIERHGHQHRPAKAWTEASERMAELAQEVVAPLGRFLRFVDTGGVCDGNNMSAAGVGVLDTIGIQGANIHTDEEFATVSDLHGQAAFVAALIESIAVSSGEGA